MTPAREGSGCHEHVARYRLSRPLRSVVAGLRPDAPRATARSKLMTNCCAIYLLRVFKFDVFLRFFSLLALQICFDVFHVFANTLGNFALRDILHLEKFVGRQFVLRESLYSMGFRT